MELYHNARKLEYRTPYGAVPVGTAITLRIDAPEAEPGQVYLRLWTGEETLISMKKETNQRYSAEITAPETPGLVWYYFQVDAPGGTDGLQQTPGLSGFSASGDNGQHGITSLQI